MNCRPTVRQLSPSRFIPRLLDKRQVLQALRIPSGELLAETVSSTEAMCVALLPWRPGWTSTFPTCSGCLSSKTSAMSSSLGTVWPGWWSLAWPSVDPDRLAHLVYLDADVPRDGESSLDCHGLRGEARTAFVARAESDVRLRPRPGSTHGGSLSRRTQPGSTTR